MPTFGPRKFPSGASTDIDRSPTLLLCLSRLLRLETVDLTRIDFLEAVSQKLSFFIIRRLDNFYICLMISYLQICVFYKCLDLKSRKCLRFYWRIKKCSFQSTSFIIFLQNILFHCFLDVKCTKQFIDKKSWTVKKTNIGEIIKHDWTQ